MRPAMRAQRESVETFGGLRTADAKEINEGFEIDPEKLRQGKETDDTKIAKKKTYKKEHRNQEYAGQT